MRTSPGGARSRRCALLFASMCWTVWAAEVPGSVRQGQAVRITLDTPAQTARLGKRTVSLFPQPDGTWQGLMPVGVTETPGAHRLEILNDRGDVVRSFSVLVRDGRFRHQNIRVTRGMRELKPLSGEMEAVHALEDTVSPDRRWTEPFVSPTPGCMISEFGVLRFHNGKYTGTYHKGIDLASPLGTSVHATAAGVVRIAQMFRLHGGTVGLDHGQGLTSLYIHLSRLLVKEGQQVKKGDVIAEVGATGFATGPHLHWGLYVNGLPVNPMQWTRPDPRRCR